MKKFLSSLGVFGVILYYIFMLTISVLPFVMISGSFWIRFILIGIEMIFPATSIIFWIWGLVCAIRGVQDIFAIIYYVLFVILYFPFFISTIVELFRK